ncbi:MAG: leucine-rich repeat domain-containing protein [Bacteroidales bacterium]|nr:leucine-rich repeat domain-containing protein [Bacteroidales bacterium]
MKKTLLFLALLLGIALHSWAYDFSAIAPSGQTLYYNIVDGNAEVTSQYTGSGDSYYNYPSGDLTIPSTVTNNGTTYSVTSIGERAFRCCSGLTSVAIPNAVTSIGSSAFFYCSGLTSVTIPNSVTTIGMEAFGGCSGLTSVILGNSVTSIGNSAFYGCSGITGTLTIPNSVTSIEERAFYDCSGITGTLTIPNSVTSIGEYAFKGCSGLTAIIVENDNTIYDSRNNCNALIETATNTLLLGCENTIIPNSVTSIVDYAFYNCSGLTSVILGNSVTTIGGSAFEGCTGLTGALNIPSSVTSIGYKAFYGCSGITEIHSHAYVAPTLGSNAFNGVTNTIPVYIPCGASASYYSRWSYFSNFIEGSAFTFSAVSADNNMGAVQILTMPTCTNPQAVIYASANSGYRFDHWSDGNTANPRVLTVTEDTELTGYFVPDGGGTQGIDDVTSADGMKVYSRGNRIMVETVGASTQAQNDAITVYDVMGRVIKQAAGSGLQAAVEIPVTSAGVYMVKVGDTQPQKVVVRR